MDVVRHIDCIQREWSGWTYWIPYIDGWIPRFSLFFPIVGYLILFNDSVSESLVFSRLTGTEIQWGFSGDHRIRFLYFGLLSLGISNFLYKTRKPHIFRFGKSLIEYTHTGLEFFTYNDFLQMHEYIQNEGHNAIEEKYRNDEWVKFSDMANTNEGWLSIEKGSGWEKVTKTHGGLLRSILKESFYYGDRQRRVSLSICVVLSTIGYLLLITPGIELFIKVTMSTLSFIGE